MAISQVSVVIPTLNRVHTLRRALDSVISQTYKTHSIVVIDDGSTDGTSDMINEYYPQIIFIKQDNQGVSAARNTGINSIDAEWIAFLDSDDFWYSNNEFYQYINYQEYETTDDNDIPESKDIFFSNW